MNYTLSLLKAREADAQVDTEVLAGRMELSRNFDTLNAQMQRYTESFKELQSLPDFLAETDKNQLITQLDQVDKAWQQNKQALIEAINFDN